jgi:hypothetical protein
VGGAAVTAAGFITGVDVLGVFETGVVVPVTVFVLSTLLEGNVVAVACVLVPDPIGLLVLGLVGETG